MRPLLGELFALTFLFVCLSAFSLQNNKQLLAAFSDNIAYTINIIIHFQIKLKTSWAQ
jgi:hypothetical protein